MRTAHHVLTHRSRRAAGWRATRRESATRDPRRFKQARSRVLARTRAPPGVQSAFLQADGLKVGQVLRKFHTPTKLHRIAENGQANGTSAKPPKIPVPGTDQPSL